MVSSGGLSEELTVTVAVLCMPGRVSKQNPAVQFHSKLVCVGMSELCMRVPCSRNHRVRSQSIQEIASIVQKHSGFTSGHPEESRN